MTENSKIFTLSFLAVFSLTFCADILYSRAEDFFWARDINQAPARFFIADIAENFQKQKTANKDCSLSAESAIAVFINKERGGSIVFEKNAYEIRPIASLTKLMTAVIADEFYQPADQIPVSLKAVSQDESFGQLSKGEKFTSDSLMLMALNESSNDAAYALAEPMEVEGFIALMNLKSKDLGLQNTYFYNPNGLDPEKGDELNYSTARDLAHLAKYILGRPRLLQIMGQETAPVYFADGRFHHTALNTNLLLVENNKIAGGKTGWTEKAGECLLLISRGNLENTYYINVVLGSQDRFGDTRKMIECYN